MEPGTEHSLKSIFGHVLNNTTQLRGHLCYSFVPVDCNIKIEICVCSYFRRSLWDGSQIWQKVIFHIRCPKA
jgi:hypothetical protein